MLVGGETVLFVVKVFHTRVDRIVELLYLLNRVVVGVPEDHTLVLEVTGLELLRHYANWLW